jgi:hypothetical protein
MHQTHPRSSRAPARCATALLLGLVGLAPAPGRAAPPAREALGTLPLKRWDARQEVFFDTVTAHRQGCELGFRVTYQRKQTFPLKLRLHLTLDGAPGPVSTPWAENQVAGESSLEGTLPTEGCWIKRVKRLTAVTTETLGEPPREVPKGGRVFLGKVIFDQWGQSADVFYRHIQAWKEGCRLHYQFLYKRPNASRRRLRMKLDLDSGSVTTPWVRSKEAGWREIAGDFEPAGCQVDKATKLGTASFESERY